MPVLVPGKMHTSWYCQQFASSLRALQCVATLVALLSAGSIGCSRFANKATRGYQTLPKQPQEKAEQAKKLNAKGLAAFENGDLEKAESLFREALAIDVDYGPAHNNLGQIYLKRHQLYLAAWEFEFAANLMPNRSQAQTNLGLVYETAGQLEQALPYYETAYELEPSNANSIGNLARLSVKLDADAARTSYLLQQVIMHDDRQDWVKWAADLLATRYRPTGEPSMMGIQNELIEPEPIDLPFPVGPEALPVPQPKVEEIPFDMPAAFPLGLSGRATPGSLLVTPASFPQVPASYATQANYEGERSQ